MKRFLAGMVVAAALASAPVGAQGLLEALKDAVVGPPTPAQIAAAREEVQEAAGAALSALYAILPSARTAVERAAGYAAFSTFGMKLMVAGGTSGKGLAVDQGTHAQTYMKMLQVQGGLGFGIAQNQLIFVFTTPQALSDFINQGWEFGAQANVAARAAGEGDMFSGAASISPGVYLYQITQTGLSATLTVSGTRFFIDTDLN